VSAAATTSGSSTVRTLIFVGLRLDLTEERLPTLEHLELPPHV
jgi:hypothetical protein